MKIDIYTFQGIKPRIEDHLIGQFEAVKAENVKIRGGNLKMFDNTQKLSDITSTETIRTIYYYLSQFWMVFDADVDIVPGPIPTDTSNKIYYTGDGIPKKTDQTLALTGVGDYPIGYYPMAAPMAKFAATAALGAGGSGDALDRAYVWTVVSNWGEETKPSAVSNIVSARNGQTVNLSGMTLDWQAGTQYTTDDWAIPTVPNGYIYKCMTAGTTGGVEPVWGTTVDGDTTDNTCVWRCFPDNVASKRIYRVLTGNVYASYFYVDAIAAATTIYADVVPDESLGSEILTEEYDPPINTMIGLVAMSGGVLAGFSGKDIYFSEPYLPYAFPVGNSVTVDSPIVAIAAYGNQLITLTEAEPYIVTGNDPSSMTPKKMGAAHPCVSKRGAVPTERGMNGKTCCLHR
jgi:hypothetical protein